MNLLMESLVEGKNLVMTKVYSNIVDEYTFMYLSSYRIYFYEFYFYVFKWS